MNKKCTTGIVFLFLVAGLAPLDCRAASPNFVTPAGKYESWAPSATVLYDIESQNDLGKMPNAQAATIVRKAFDVWAKIATAKFPAFEETQGTDRMVKGWNGANFNTKLGNYPTDHSPIMFDSDGSITAAYGFNPDSDLAFARRNASGDGTIVQGAVIINGRAVDGLFDPDDPTLDDLTRAVVRAIGRLLGLGPSDVNDELIFDGNLANNSAVPIMHPLTQTGLVVGGGFALTLDDQMGASLIYPADNIDTKLGTIQGKVLLADGTTGLQGIDVIAHKVDDPVNSAVSAISGVTFRVQSGNGVEDLSQRGFFQMKVPPGSYTLEFRSLRQDLGPIGIFPLPGGRQFYGATSSPTAAPPTPITVTVGQTTEVNYTAPGKPAPASQAVAQVKPNESPTDAQLVPLSASVAGHVAPTDPALINLYLGQDSNGNTLNEKIANLYRLAVPERSIVTLFLQPQPAGNKVELHLYLIDGILGGANPPGFGALSADNGAKSLQLALDPGTYLIGVSTAAKIASDYALSITTTPLVVPAATPAPVLDHLVLRNVTDTGAQASWITDADTTADALVALPRQDFGDPMASKAHQITITGLTAGADADLFAISQTTDGVSTNLPRVFFHTAASTAATGAAKLNAAVVATVGDVIGPADAPQDTVLVEIAFQNSGGPLTNGQIATLTASKGWKLAQPITQPLVIGGIGSGGTAIVVVRLLRDGTGPAPLATVTGTGTFAGAGGAATNFTISGP